MGISGQTIWRQTGNFLRKQKIIRKITYYEPGFRKASVTDAALGGFSVSHARFRDHSPVSIT